MSEPVDYLLARLHDAMLRDERLHEQAIEIVVVGGDRLELRGEVATPARRVAAVALARELAPGVDVIDDLRVSRIVASADDPELL